jgi:putative hydrolase of the HAD superfamily
LEGFGNQRAFGCDEMNPRNPSSRHSQRRQVGVAELKPSAMKTFVFDADGVICVGGNFSISFAREHRIPHERLTPFFTGPFAECVLGRRDLKEVLPPYAVEWGWPGSVEDLLALWFQREHVISAKALECVRSLRKKGHVCVLGTNQEKYRANYLRREMRLAEEFDQIFASCELGVAKPSAEFFSRIQEHLKITAEDLCLIDDSERNVAAAKIAGWRSVWYRGLSDIEAIEREADQSLKPIRS